MEKKKAGKKTTKKSKKKTLFCKYCGTEMKASTKVCPNCKQKQGDGIFKVISMVLIILLLISTGVLSFLIIKNKDSQEVIELTIPAEFIDEQTQANMKEQEKEYGYKFTLNDDGSATCIMTKSQHKKVMDEMADSLNESLDEMIGSENYPNFTKIESNDNFTEFTITTKSTELDMVESFSVMAFYMYGGLYNIFSGEEVDNVSVTFINADSGQVIQTANSSDMEHLENESQEILN